MGLLDFLRKKEEQPYRNEAFNEIYDLLFCDKLELFKNDNAYPCDILCSKQFDPMKLNMVIKDPSVESRHKVLAYNRLRVNKTIIEEKELLGVIVEVGLDNGLDVLAVYKDGRARYINQHEKLLVWEAKTEESDALVQRLLAASEEVVKQIGPWNKGRRRSLAKGMIRLTFLVSDGLYFGEGPFIEMQKDKLAASVIAASIDMMGFLLKQNT